MEPSCFLILSAKDMLLRKDRTSQPPSLWKQHNEIPCSILYISTMGDDARVGSDGCKNVSDTTTSSVACGLHEVRLARGATCDIHK
jgi:hypothetical protein